MTSKQIYQALLMGKEITDGFTTYKLINDELFFKDILTEGKYTQIDRTNFTIIEPKKVKEGQEYKREDKTFVVISTGEKTLRLINMSTWKSDGNNYYGMNTYDMEVRGYFCAK